MIEEAPVSLNTFRKMLKEDVSHLNEKIEIYRKQMEEQHDREVEKKRRQTYQKQITGPQPRHTGRRRCGPVPAAVPPVLRHGNSFPRSRKRRRTGTCKRVGRPPNGIPPPETFPAGVMQGSDSSERPPYTRRTPNGACDGTDVIYT